MKKSFVAISIIVALTCSMNAPAFAATRNKANNQDDLNLASSWNILPGVGDIARWRGTEVLGANTTVLGADLTWQGIRIVDPGGAITINAGNTLTIGAAAKDIDMDSATQDLTLNCGLALNAANVWGVTAGRTLTVGGNVDNGTNLLTVQGGGNTNIGGVISNTGGLTKDGAGALTLSGANTYGGVTTLDGGTLNINNASALGTGAFTITGGTTIDNTSGGALTLTNNNAQAWNGNFAFTGTNDLDLGTGAVTLSANRTVTVNGGNLTVGGSVGDLGAGRRLIKNGIGILTLSGANTYTGRTDINAGILRVSNSDALGGIAGGNVNNNATLDIGSTNLNIGGNYTQGAGATLMVAVNGVSSGSIIAAGNATVNAGDPLTLNVTNYVPNGATYRIIDGAGGAGVAVPTITVTGSNQATFTATTVGADLVLTADRSANGFASIATTGDSNASAVGATLDTIQSPSADMTTVLNTMGNLSDSQVAAALDTLVPQVDAGVINTSTTTLNNFVGVAVDRLEKVLTLAKNTTDSGATGISAGDENRLTGIWGKGYGSWMTQGMRNGIAGYDAWNAGTALGIDRMVSDDIIVGISGGYAYGNVDSDVNNANTYINSGQVTVYGGYQDKNLPYFIDVAGVFAYNCYNGQRDINIGGAILRTANADYDGQQYGAYVGGGYKINLIKNIEFTPLLSLQWNHLHLGSYTETEADALNLSVASQDYDQLQTGVGARIAAPKKYIWGTFTPEAHGKWFYDFIGDPFASTSNFNGGGAAFNSNGCKPALNSFNAGGQVILDFNNDVSVIGCCDTEMKNKFFGIYGSVTLRYSF